MARAVARPSSQPGIDCSSKSCSETEHLLTTGDTGDPGTHHLEDIGLGHRRDEGVELFRGTRQLDGVNVRPDIHDLTAENVSSPFHLITGDTNGSMKDMWLSKNERT